jgi:hypothetical protein
MGKLEAGGRAYRATALAAAVRAGRAALESIATAVGNAIEGRGSVPVMPVGVVDGVVEQQSLEPSASPILPEPSRAA